MDLQKRKIAAVYKDATVEAIIDSIQPDFRKAKRDAEKKA